MPQNTDYDSPWKEALERYFPNFMQLLFAETYTAIDWTQPYEFLDKELQKIVRDADSGRRHTDKLVKVFTQEGQETWVLVHIEVQGKADRHFNTRMFRYYYRLQDRHRQQKIASLAVLTDQTSAKSIGCYQQSLWHTKICFEFPVVNLQDWNNRQAELENHPNPFALLILAQLIAHRTTQDLLTRKEDKFQLIKRLYVRGYEKQDILELFRFIDWMLQLPEALELELNHAIEQFEEEHEMPYITAIERFAIEKGKQEGMAEILLKLFKLKFGPAPDWVETKVNQANLDELEAWTERILTASSVDCLFVPHLDG